MSFQEDFRSVEEVRLVANQLDDASKSIHDSLVQGQEKSRNDCQREHRIRPQSTGQLSLPSLALHQ